MEEKPDSRSPELLFLFYILVFAAGFILPTFLFWEFTHELPFDNYIFWFTCICIQIASLLVLNGILKKDSHKGILSQEVVNSKRRKLLKKFLFFWCILHLCAYTCFVLRFSPSFEDREKVIVLGNQFREDTYRNDVYVSYIFIPEYRENFNGEAEMYPDCSNCNFKEKSYFWPFHSFYYHVNSDHIERGFIGIFGYYGHYEFLFYVVLPIIIFLLSILYKKFIR